jgi:hypothetical protein
MVVPGLYPPQGIAGSSGYTPDHNRHPYRHQGMALALHNKQVLRVFEMMKIILDRLMEYVFFLAAPFFFLV